MPVKKGKEKPKTDSKKTVELLETINNSLVILVNQIERYVHGDVDRPIEFPTPSQPTPQEVEGKELSQKQQEQKTYTNSDGIVEVISDSVSDTPKLIDRRGNAIVLYAEDVLNEAKKLCGFDQESKGGFKRAQEIIASAGVQKLADLKPEQFPSIVMEFRRAIASWK